MEAVRGNNESGYHKSQINHQRSTRAFEEWYHEKDKIKSQSQQDLDRPCYHQETSATSYVKIMKHEEKELLEIIPCRKETQ